MCGDLFSTHIISVQSSEPNSDMPNYSHPRCETHNYSHLNDDKCSSSCMPESGKEDLSYSHLHQGPDDEKQSYSYCDVGVKVMLSYSILE